MRCATERSVGQKTSTRPGSITTTVRITIRRMNCSQREEARLPSGTRCWTGTRVQETTSPAKATAFLSPSSFNVPRAEISCLPCPVRMNRSRPMIPMTSRVRATGFLQISLSPLFSLSSGILSETVAHPLTRDTHGPVTTSPREITIRLALQVLRAS